MGGSAEFGHGANTGDFISKADLDLNILLLDVRMSDTSHLNEIIAL